MRARLVSLRGWLGAVHGVARQVAARAAAVVTKRSGPGAIRDVTAQLVPLGFLCLIAGWLSLAFVGWLCRSVTLTALAPPLLLPLPVLLARLRDGPGWRPIDPFEPIWALSVLYGFTYLIVPGLSAARPDEFASLEGYLDAPPGTWQVASWLAALAFLCLLVGYFGPLSRAPARAGPCQRGPDGDRHIAPLAAALFVLGVASVALALVVNDGFSVPLSELVTGGLREETVKSYSGRGYLSLGFAFLALSIPCAAVRACRRRSWRDWALVALAAAIAELLLAGIVGSRLLALGVPVAVLVVVHYRLRRLRAGLVAAGAATLALLGVVVAAARGTGSVADPIAAVGTLGLTLDGFNFLVNALARVNGFLWGATFFEDAFLTYFPRAIWEGKPTIYGVVSAQEAIVPGLYADFQGGATFPPGILAEGYVNFGLAGVLLLPVAVGAAFRAAYACLLKEQSAFSVLLMGWLLANLVTLFRGFGLIVPQVVVTAAVLSPLLMRAAPSTAPFNAEDRGF